MLCGLRSGSQMPSPAPDDHILARIRSGDTAAFEEFVEAWQDRIFGFGLRMCGHREDALDVLQETLLQAFRKLDTVEHPRALKSWIFRVASNACLMKRRRGKYEPARELSIEDLMPRGPADVGPQLPDPADLPDADAMRNELSGAVRRAISELPETYRPVLILRDLEELTTSEVAQALDLPETTVKMRLHRGRLMVRRALQEAISVERPA
jgi:RNA polymerase sigma-70 factor (ECF subfamily)